MPVLDRSELQASPLADLHALANELSVDGYRLLDREDLIEAILAGGEVPAGARRRGGRSAARVEEETAPAPRAERSRRRAAPDGVRAGAREGRRGRADVDGTRGQGQRTRGSGRGRRGAVEEGGRGADLVEGVVELREGGSAFLRLSPPGPSDEDVYISPAQVKRCELQDGDRVSGPVRAPRRSERYASLSRIETINGVDADQAVKVPARAAGERAPAAPGRRTRSRRGGAGGGAEGGPSFPTELIAFASGDAALAAVQRVAPIGFGSRAVIAGPTLSGKSELLRRIAAALAAREDVRASLVLIGVRPEEVPEWEAGPLAPAAALTLVASPQEQAQALERVIDDARRTASGGRHAVVLIDTLDGLEPHDARRALAEARARVGRGTLTVIATAARPFGGETTVIGLDAALAGAGRFPVLDAKATGTLRPELLVGEEGVQAIARARAESERQGKGRRWFWRR
ncbi:MAG: Rho termination factor N-terminal domain-containing protein [Acidobacteriota bacterium]|nr:Rho termination factor N-terminal domain-containing protein [Acidobacteriota bacterium]